MCIGHHLRVQPCLELGDPGVVLGEHVEVGDTAGSQVSRFGCRRRSLDGWPGPATSTTSDAAITAILANAVTQAKVDGAASGESIGSVVLTGDVNGDGLEDLLVGSGWNDSVGEASGAVYVVLGPVSGAADIEDAEAVLLGEASKDYAGTAVALGDFDGDGTPDVAVGAPGESWGGSGAGSTYVDFGPVTGRASLEDAEVKLYG